MKKGEIRIDLDTGFEGRPMDGKFCGGLHHSAKDDVDFCKRMEAAKIPVKTRSYKYDVGYPLS